jgi:hypothetical protein
MAPRQRLGPATGAPGPHHTLTPLYPYTPTPRYQLTHEVEFS